jgi:hypothetical protein
MAVGVQKSVEVFQVAIRQAPNTSRVKKRNKSGAEDELPSHNLLNERFQDVELLRSLVRRVEDREHVIFNQKKEDGLVSIERRTPSGDLIYRTPYIDPKVLRKICHDFNSTKSAINSPQSSIGDPGFYYGDEIIRRLIQQFELEDVVKLPIKDGANVAVVRLDPTKRIIGASPSLPPAFLVQNYFNAPNDPKLYLDHPGLITGNLSRKPLLAEIHRNCETHGPEGRGMVGIVSHNDGKVSLIRYSPELGSHIQSNPIEPEALLSEYLNDDAVKAFFLEWPNIISSDLSMKEAVAGYQVHMIMFNRAGTCPLVRINIAEGGVGFTKLDNEGVPIESSGYLTPDELNQYYFTDLNMFVYYMQNPQKILGDVELRPVKGFETLSSLGSRPLGAREMTQLKEEGRLLHVLEVTNENLLRGEVVAWPSIPLDFAFNLSKMDGGLDLERRLQNPPNRDIIISLCETAILSGRIPEGKFGMDAITAMEQKGTLVDTLELAIQSGMYHTRGELYRRLSNAKEKMKKDMESPTRRDEINANRRKKALQAASLIMKNPNATYPNSRLALLIKQIAEAGKPEGEDKHILEELIRKLGIRNKIDLGIPNDLSAKDSTPNLEVLSKTFSDSPRQIFESAMGLYASCPNLDGIVGETIKNMVMVVIHTGNYSYLENYEFSRKVKDALHEDGNLIPLLEHQIKERNPKDPTREQVKADYYYYLAKAGIKETHEDSRIEKVFNMINEGRYKEIPETELAELRSVMREGSDMDEPVVLERLGARGRVGLDKNRDYITEKAKVEQRDLDEYL